MRAEGGIRALNISHVANPTLDFDTPSGKIEFFSEKAERLGLPPLPSYQQRAQQSPDDSRAFPLTLTQGRTMVHFHSFYNNGQALPTLARRESEPRLWISKTDAAVRNVVDGDAIRIFNRRGEMMARAYITDRTPPGTVWMRDGWLDLNSLTSGASILPDAALDLFGFTVGQASFEAVVEVELASTD